MARLGLAIHEFRASDGVLPQVIVNTLRRWRRVLVDAKAKPWHDGLVLGGGVYA
jgi:hypothetical protein